MQEVFKNIQAFDTPNNGFYTHSAIRVSDGETVYFAKKRQLNIPEETIVEYSDIKTTGKGNPSYRGVKILNQANTSANSIVQHSSPTPQVQPTSKVTSDVELFLGVARAIAPLYHDGADGYDFDEAVSAVFNKAVELMPKVKQIGGE